MLKTSPILSTSANASPTTFRYAHRSPQNPSKPSTAIGRRPSLRSDPCPTDPMNTSPQQRPRQYVANDSGVQGPATESHRHSSSSLSQKPLAQTTTPPGPLPTANPPTVTQPSQPSHPSQPQVSNESQVPQSGVSPVKRRSSPPQPSAQASNSTWSPSQQTSKRAKPESPPPKILPLQYEFCPVEDMVELIAHMLGELIATNDAIRSSNGGLTRFHSRTAPGISVRDYLHRLARHATLIPPLLLAMVYYIDRLCALYPEFTINTLTVHRFLITAATVAAKGLSDSFWNNTTYARVGGVRLAELKLLELEFLYRVDWKIVPNPEVLVAYYKGLVERTPGYALENEESEDDEDDEDDEGNQQAQNGQEDDLEP